MPSSAIPYDEIDAEIRPLIVLMNRLPGIRTEYSCIGHDEGDEGYISFRADCQEALERLLKCLPVGPQFSCNCQPFQENVRWNASNVIVDVYEGQARYRLSLRGSPLFMQRQLVASIEKALRESVAA